MGNIENQKHKLWNDLSMTEKAEMMKVAVRNGITDLDTIRQKYNEFAEGGNIYDGESEPTQQMKLGRDYWQSQVAESNWYDAIDPPVNGKPLQEIIVTPTNDQNWLFSQGKYARNTRQPLADEPTRKVVAEYLSRYDNEDAAHYNDRVTRLADAIYRTNGVIFRSNNVKEGKLRNRAHYNPTEDVAYVNSMDDLFSELAHPYQDWLGNNRNRDEYVKGYDADIDPRGGTRYAYPDTYEGETHGFFEPALTEYITTGKISRSLPMLNKTLSDEKITPKEWKEVTDSAASWNKQAIDRRIISMPSQLPLFDRIKYSVIDYPLLEKNEYSEGGSIHIDPSKRGTFTAAATKHGMGVQEFASKVLANKENYSPAMVKKANFARNASKFKHSFGGPLVDRAMNYFEDGGFKEEDRFATTEMPELVVTAPYLFDSQRMRVNLQENIARAQQKNALDSYRLQRNMNQAQETVARNYGLPLMAGIAAGPVFNTLTAAGEAAYPILTNPYVDAGITSVFGAHGMNDAVNGRGNWMTALELMPLTRVAKPVVRETALGLANGLFAIDKAVETMDQSNLGRMMLDIGSSPIDTYKALKNGRYVYNFPSLRRNIERAHKEIMEGVRSTNGEYLGLTGKAIPEVPIQIRDWKHFKKGDADYSSKKKLIRSTLTKNERSNIVKDADYFNRIGGHEQAHAASDYLSTTYNTPRLRVWDSKSKTYMPNKQHPIAAYYYDAFMASPKLHGMSPEETWANYMGAKANGLDYPAFMKRNLSLEGFYPPEGFIEDYSNYLRANYNDNVSWDIFNN